MTQPNINEVIDVDPDTNAKNMVGLLESVMRERGIEGAAFELGADRKLSPESVARLRALVADTLDKPSMRDLAPKDRPREEVIDKLVQGFETCIADPAMAMSVRINGAVADALDELEGIGELVVRYAKREYDKDRDPKKLFRMGEMSATIASAQIELRNARQMWHALTCDCGGGEHDAQPTEPPPAETAPEAPSA